MAPTTRRAALAALLVASAMLASSLPAMAVEDHSGFPFAGATSGRGLLETLPSGSPVDAAPVSPGVAAAAAAAKGMAPGTVYAAGVKKLGASKSARVSVPAGRSGHTIATRPVAPKAAAPKLTASKPVAPAPAPKPVTLADIIGAAAKAAEVMRSVPAPRPSTPEAPAPPAASGGSTAGAPVPRRIDPATLERIKRATGRCSLAQQLLGTCKHAPSAPPPPPPPPAPPAPPPSYTYMEQSIRNGTCNATLLNNGDFQKDARISATTLTGWAKLKENTTVGGGGLYDGKTGAYTGRPGYPFDTTNRYFRSRQKGAIAFALVNNAPVNVTNPDSYLYFDWFVDNPWPYWFVAQTMSINANNSDIVVHQARVDLYDYDKLTPPGNFTQLAQLLFDQADYKAGDAYLGPILPAEIVAATPNLASMATEVPLKQFVGKRVLVAFRYSTNVNYIGWGIDNVMLVDCQK
ncbi:hypothetical protein Rsub_01638 [Raphidocelis subcapitata]|uniref:Uncharacterized protein n=1 Tax=Raphidocelis subcapitata TaxID=307507 RepID=A0A2V0NUW7_9CHLO|nr:hypothetical protein Rsub_01638 [Raphidocelis subcapitata]|eukprot:GBF88737.1 hypothetical protein Rsub_01638 [Raphidocelis subcapitata]